LIFNAVLQEVKDMLTIIEDFEDVECIDEGLFCLFQISIDLINIILIINPVILINIYFSSSLTIKVSFFKTNPLVMI